MDVIASILDVLANEQARARLVIRAMEREEFLIELGRLYRTRLASQIEAVAVGRGTDLEIALIETRSGIDAGNQVPTNRPERFPRGIARALQGFLASATSSQAPEALIVLGQSGAGKGPIVEAARRVFNTREGCVAVDVNDWVYLHPGFESAGSVPVRDIARDSRQWADQLFNQALGECKHIVVESCGSVPHFLDVLRQLGEKNYRVSVVVLRMEAELSWWLAEERCRYQIERTGTGRRVGRSEHDESIETVEACLALTNATFCPVTLFVVDAMSYRLIESASLESSRELRDEVEQSDARDEPILGHSGLKQNGVQRHETHQPLADWPTGPFATDDENKIARFRSQLAKINGMPAGQSPRRETPTDTSATDEGKEIARFRCQLAKIDGPLAGRSAESDERLKPS